jgi:hypothetical protein
MTPARGSAEGVETEVVASRFRVDPGFPLRGPRDMNKVRRQRHAANFARLRRHLDLSLDPDKPRRLRTRSARYAAALAEQLGLLERPARCSWCRRRKRLERHHWDYDEPLVVTYLCPDCHDIADEMVARKEIA